MYLGECDTLGATPLDAIFAISALKQLFGIGRKKAELKSIEQNAKGQWTSQLPPYADWNEFLSRPASNPKAKAAGAKTYRDEYNFWKGRKDSILIKNQIATPEDYAAYLVITYGLKDGWIKPSAKPGDPFYKNGPFALQTQIPIFDYQAIAGWAAKQQTQYAPVQLTPANVVAPTLNPASATPAPGFVERLATNIQTQQLPAANLLPPSAAPASAVAVAPAAPSYEKFVLPGMILAGVGLVLLTQKKNRRR